MQSIKTFFKQYWFNLLLLSCYALLVFFIIPSQEQSYIDADKERIENYASTTVIIIGGLLAILVIIFGIRSAKGFEKVFSVLGGGIAIFVLVLLCVKPLFISTYFLVNKLYAREQVEKKYTFVKYQQGETYWLLKDGATSEVLSSLDYPYETNLAKYKNSDTVRIKFKRGLLGVNHSPEVIVKAN